MASPTKEPTHGRRGHLPHHTLVITEDFCQAHPPPRRPGPEASLCEGELITLAIFARWSRFASERDFYRFACSNLREAFPTLPERSQFNRLVRFYADDIEKMALHLAQMTGDSQRPYQALDASAMPVGDAKRRGHGWLAGRAETSAGPTAWAGN